MKSSVPPIQIKGHVKRRLKSLLGDLGVTMQGDLFDAYRLRSIVSDNTPFSVESKEWKTGSSLDEVIEYLAGGSMTPEQLIRWLRTNPELGDSSALFLLDNTLTGLNHGTRNVGFWENGDPDSNFTTHKLVYGEPTPETSAPGGESGPIDTSGAVPTDRS